MYEQLPVNNVCVLGVTKWSASQTSVIVWCSCALGARHYVVVFLITAGWRRRV